MCIFVLEFFKKYIDLFLFISFFKFVIFYVKGAFRVTEYE